jgi:hypothetical protein
MKVITKEKGQYESSDPLFLQQGGDVSGNGMVYGGNYRPLVTGQGTTTQTQDKREKSDSNSSDIMGKGLINQIMGKGITNDVYANIQSFMDIQEAYNKLTDTEKASSQGIMVLQQM